MNMPDCAKLGWSIVVSWLVVLFALVVKLSIEGEDPTGVELTYKGHSVMITKSQPWHIYITLMFLVITTMIIAFGDDRGRVFSSRIAIAYIIADVFIGLQISLLSDTFDLGSIIPILFIKFLYGVMNYHTELRNSRYYKYRRVSDDPDTILHPLELQEAPLPPTAPVSPVLGIPHHPLRTEEVMHTVPLNETEEQQEQPRPVTPIPKDTLSGVVVANDEGSLSSDANLPSIPTRIIVPEDGTEPSIQTYSLIGLGIAIFTFAFNVSEMVFMNVRPGYANTVRGCIVAVHMLVIVTSFLIMRGYHTWYDLIRFIVYLSMISSLLIANTYAVHV